MTVIPVIPPKSQPMPRAKPSLLRFAKTAAEMHAMQSFHTRAVSSPALSSGAAKSSRRTVVAAVSHSSSSCTPRGGSSTTSTAAAWSFRGCGARPAPVIVGPRMVVARFRNPQSDGGDVASPPASEVAAATGLAAEAAMEQAAEQQDAALQAPPVPAENGSSCTASERRGEQQGASSGSSGQQKLKRQLEDLNSKYQALDQRLDSLEGTLITLLKNVKEKARRPAASAAVGPAGEAAADGEGVLLEASSGDDLPDMLDADEDEDDEHGGLFDLKKLQTSLSMNINRGFLESVKHLREMLMAYEWHLHGKELAERKGVAVFEQHCAQADLPVSFEAVSQLYTDPNDLSVLPDNKTKLLARSIIQQAVDERYCSIYWECTATAKELAHTGLKDVIPDSAGKVGGVIKDLLPLPGFMKK